MIDGFIATFFSKFRFYGGYMFAVERTWEEAVDQGDVSGASILRMYGRNAASVDGDALWAPSTAYTWQTADQQPLVVSSSANDDASPASGANTVRIWWMNSANVEAYEDVELNGVANVAMVANTVRRINRVEVLTCGTTGWNEGNISVLDSAGAVTMAYMPIGQNVNDGIIQTVPAGKADYIRRVGFFASGETRALLRYRASPTDPWLSEIPLSTDGFTHPYYFEIPYKIPSGYDYYVALSTAGSYIISASVYGWRINA